MYYNKNSFQNKKFNENTFKRSVNLDHQPFLSEIPTNYIFNLHMTEVSTKDNYFVQT
jgi:hypothetical protein